MIISRTPFRISLFGGGTDYPTWYREHGGRVLGFAIDKYCYITVRHLPPFFEHRFRIVYSRIELVNEVSDIVHPSVRAVLGELAVTDGLEVHHDGDLPARSGLGSSSSFTVGLVNSLNALKGQMSSKRQLAESAIDIEQNVIGEAVGSQDQIWAAFGGLNRIEFLQDGSFDVQPVLVSAGRRRRLTNSMMLFFTGLSRNAPTIASAKIANLGKRASELNQMAAMVDEAQAILQDPLGDLDAIGHLLHRSWMLKRQLAKEVSTDVVDVIYDKARAAGAIGGKLLGAGGGGFILFYVPWDKQPAVRAALADLIHVPFDISMEGSRIIIYEPDPIAD